ncbi:E3 ubiquitin-protein ligase ARIH1 [Pelomyxa schiedti]|nr:E3 ubiquitin-protein ligase ARIH1 [Pelomyxa schiedti]
MTEDLELAIKLFVEEFKEAPDVSADLINVVTSELDALVLGERNKSEAQRLHDMWQQEQSDHDIALSFSSDQVTSDFLTAARLYAGEDADRHMARQLNNEPQFDDPYARQARDVLTAREIPRGAEGTAPTRQPQLRIEGTCASCLEKREVAYRAACNCNYCSVCLSRLYRTAINDISLIPVRCHTQNFPSEIAERVLSEPLLSEYKRRVAQNEEAIRNKAGALAHTQEMLVAGEIDISLRGKKWQTCSGCGNVVLISTGCNHMTCICRHQFCLVCGIAWKNCECPQWAEENLVVEQQERPAFAPFIRRLGRENRECDHLFVYHPGRGECATCHWTTDLYFFQCRHCGLITCRMCRDNRT